LFSSSGLSSLLGGFDAWLKGVTRKSEDEELRKRKEFFVTLTGAEIRTLDRKIVRQLFYQLADGIPVIFFLILIFVTL
jgi:hypothetical protein